MKWDNMYAVRMCCIILPRSNWTFVHTKPVHPCIILFSFLLSSGICNSYIDHIYALIDASSMLNVNMVTTFLGRVPDKNVEENLEIVKEVWPPILE